MAALRWPRSFLEAVKCQDPDSDVVLLLYSGLRSLQAALVHVKASLSHQLSGAQDL